MSNPVTTTTSVPTNSSSVRQQFDITPAVNGLDPSLPPSSSNQEPSAAMDTNSAANTRGRAAGDSGNTTSENGRPRSASGNRRRNRRRRRRARSAGNASSHRTNQQQIEQTGLQRTSLAGNYNLPRSTTINNNCASDSNSGTGLNHTVPSTPVSDAVPEGPEEEATKCQVSNFD